MSLLLVRLWQLQLPPPHFGLRNKVLFSRGRSSSPHKIALILSRKQAHDICIGVCREYATDETGGLESRFESADRSVAV
jgi:hypothetical protein